MNKVIKELVALSREGVQVYLTNSGSNGCLQIVLVDIDSSSEKSEGNLRKLGVTFNSIELHNLHKQIGEFLEREATRQRSERNSGDCDSPHSCGHKCSA